MMKVKEDRNNTKQMRSTRSSDKSNRNQEWRYQGDTESQTWRMVHEYTCGAKILVTRVTGGNSHKIYRYTQVTTDWNTPG